MEPNLLPVIVLRQPTDRANPPETEYIIIPIGQISRIEVHRRGDTLLLVQITYATGMMLTLDNPGTITQFMLQLNNAVAVDETGQKILKQMMEVAK